MIEKPIINVDYKYRNRIVKVIQVLDKYKRVEVLDSNIYKKGMGGFFINYSELFPLLTEEEFDEIMSMPSLGLFEEIAMERREQEAKEEKDGKNS